MADLVSQLTNWTEFVKSFLGATNVLELTTVTKHVTPSNKNIRKWSERKSKKGDIGKGNGKDAIFSEDPDFRTRKLKNWRAFEIFNCNFFKIAIFFQNNNHNNHKCLKCSLVSIDLSFQLIWSSSLKKSNFSGSHVFLNAVFYLKNNFKDHVR